ncbi:hypothetical protein [Comamonas kerstersii]|uniref:hypothetical protein n=1 Tax=Comamonas kerstersii TaxID=225992 RepID=UPI00345CB99D
MSCSNYPQTSPSDTDGSLLVYANKSGTAALVLSTSAKVLPPAGAAFAQGLALGLAANFRVPASTVAGVTAAINSQPNNGIVGGLTFNREALAITGSAVQVLGLVAAISGIALGPLGWAAIIAAGGLNALADPAIQSLLKEHLGIDIPSLFGDPCDKGTKDPFNNAKRWQPPRDPIILDLDGDGLETVGLASNIYFDHDDDGVLTKTGWAGANDALLVWDRNGNGTIDTGAELFGDFTVLPNGTLAPNGFAALAALDANGDGVIDATDPAFAELKLWRDISQDGVSQGGELVSLADAGIVSLNLAHSLKNQRLANGNTLAREGTFTRADGSTSAMGEFKLAIDTFDTRFAEEIEVPEALRVLPNMQGAGNVRELQQAAAQSSSLAGVLAQFQNAGTRAEQKALLDQLITAWADTSGMAKSLEERASGKYRIVYEAFGNERRSSSIDTVAFAAVSSGSVGGSGGGAALMTDFGGMYLSERYRNLISEWSRKLHVLEASTASTSSTCPRKRARPMGPMILSGRWLHDRRALRADDQPAQRQGDDDLHHAPGAQGLAGG